MNPTILDYVRYVAKAIATAVVIVLTYLTSVLADNESLGDVTFTEWMWCAIWVLGGFGITYAIPNGPRPAAAAAERAAKE